MTRASSTATARRLHERYGPWAMVTGASSGIGRACAVQLAEAGLDLVLVARSARELEALGAELRARHHVETRVIAADLGDLADVDAVIDTTRDLDIGLLVAAAGFGTSGPFLQADLARESAMLDVNCRALIPLSQAFGRRFAARKRGGIVLFASVLGFQGTPYSAHYAATKAFVQTFAEGLHVELKGSGVDVLATAPGPTRSGFAERSDMRMGFALTPDTVARATLAALGHRSTVMPGALSKALTYPFAVLPRSVRARLMGRAMASMTSHRKDVAAG